MLQKILTLLCLMDSSILANWDKSIFQLRDIRFNLFLLFLFCLQKLLYLMQISIVDLYQMLQSVRGMHLTYSFFFFATSQCQFYMKLDILKNCISSDMLGLWVLNEWFLKFSSKFSPPKNQEVVRSNFLLTSLISGVPVTRCFS